MMKVARLLRVLLLTMVLASCNLAQGETVAIPTSTGVRIAPASLIAPTERHLQVAPTRPTAATPTPETAACDPDAATLPRNAVEIALDYAGKTADVRQTIALANPLPDPSNTFAFTIEANRLPNAFVLRGAVSSAPIAAVEVTGRRLVVELTETIDPGCPLEVTFSYGLTMPPVAGGAGGLSGYFGSTVRQVNIGHGLVTLAHIRDGRWAEYDATIIGEQMTNPIADWDVTVTVSGAPDGLKLAAPGAVEQVNDGEWHISHSRSRDLAISLSPFFRVIEAFAEDGTLIEVFSFDNAVVTTPAGRVDGAEQALMAAVQSLGMYADLFGPFPYDRLAIVQGDFPDGMEFSGLVFVGDQWFRTNPGTAEGYLTIITVHEVAHQWWYALVGSDQALTPWLDEALATYSEYVFYEEFHPGLTDWWWGFRVRTFVPANYSGRRVDSTVYEFATVREYINAVYLRGAEMLHQIRGVLGNDAFFAWLRRYAESGAGQIVDTEFIWSLLPTNEQSAIQLIRTTFMRAE